MKTLTRRQMVVAGGALAAGVAASTAAASQGTGPSGQASPALAQAHVFAPEALAVVHTAAGGERRDVVSGHLQTGENVALHESVLPAGAPPSPAHRIEHTEFIHVREGELEFMHDGRTERAGAGSVILVAHGTMHSVRNVGGGPAKYLVVAIGGDVKA